MGQPSIDYAPKWQDSQQRVSNLPAPTKSVYGDYKPVEQAEVDAHVQKVGSIKIESPNLKVNIDDEGHLGSAILVGVIIGILVIFVLYLKFGRSKA